MRELGRIIRRHRRRNRWSQEELGERMYVTKAAISSWECGRYVPTTNKLLRLSKLLGIPIEALLDAKHRQSESPPDVSTWSAEEDTLIYLYRTLPRMYRDIVVALLRSLQESAAEP